MPAVVQVAIHPSQFPDAVRRDLRESLRNRQVNHKFHYDSIKQTQKWLELHQACSPSRADPECAAIYDRGFEAAAARMPGRRAHLIGMGCGGGQKDARMLKLLHKKVRFLHYTPMDVSTAMVLTARQHALEIIPAAHCSPLVCDLANVADWECLFEPSATPRLITFFGMIPNFEPNTILSRLAKVVRAQDFLLFSANLTPGADYAKGVAHVLPSYDNQLTRDWLLAFLLDLGVSREDGVMRFLVEDDKPTGLKRIAAYFKFERRREIHIDKDEFEFCPGESIRLFFSYRHTPEVVGKLLGGHDLQVLEQWITNSEEEGVFLVARNPRRTRAKIRG